MRNILLITAATALMTGEGAAQLLRQAPATIKKRVVTPSGEAEMLFADRISDTRAKLAGLCLKIGWSPRLAGPVNQLDCDVPSTEKTTIALNNYHSMEEMVNGPDGGGYMDVPVRKQVTFWLSQSRGGTLVKARGERVYPAISYDRPVHRVMGDENTFNGLMNVMALIGGKFAPGTTFRRIGYIGFRSDSVVKRPPTDGRQRTGIEVGAVDVPSPAAEAGMKEGDVVIAINEQSFSEYEDAARVLSRLRPGDAVSLSVERAGKPMTIALTAGRAPNIH